MKFSTILALLPLALASPTPTTVEKRATTYCGQWDSAVTGTYTVYNNLWGMSSGTGSQCTTLTGLSGSNLQWSTTWSWSGGQYNVKSYANAVVNVSKKALSAISSIPSTWNWRYVSHHSITPYSLSKRNNQTHSLHMKTIDYDDH